jgi:hypothetical protein
MNITYAYSEPRFSKTFAKSGMVADTYNPNILEAESGVPWV